MLSSQSGPDMGPEASVRESAASRGMTPVTLCIAAACELQGKPRIVLCTDWKAEETLGGTSLGSSENADKLYWIGKGWAALIAGSESSGQELVRAFAKHMKTVKKFEWGELQEELRKPLLEHRDAVIEAHLRRTIGFSRDWFFDKGKEKLPPETVRDCIADMKRVSLGASMIISGFVTAQFNPGSPRRRQHPLIFEVQMNGSTRTCKDFTAIGEGKLIAIPTLKQRDQNASHGLLQTLYQAYEAKRLSEIIPSVGETHSIDVLAPGGSVKSLSDAGYELLDRLYTRFGPRKIKQEKFEELFKLERKHLEPFEFD